jgi:hypothetical protein
MVSFYFLNIALKIANHYKTKLLQLQKMKFFKYIFYRKKIILFIYFLLFAHATFAFENSKVVQIVDSSVTTPVGSYIYTLIDKKSIYSYNDILFNSNFRLENKEIPVMDVTRGTVWAKFFIHNNTSDSIFYLDLQYSNISEVNLYRRFGNNLVLIDSTGNNIDIDTKSESNRDFIFKLSLNSRDTAELFLKIRSKHPILLPLFIKQEGHINENINVENLIFGLYFGIILSLFLYTYFPAYFYQRPSYLFYVIHLLFLGFAQITLTGYGFKYLWPHHAFINRYALIITSAFAGITGILFALFFSG